ncbi:MAG: hypothetical protein QW520_02630 [Methanomassiliicoccales archaeon]
MVVEVAFDEVQCSSTYPCKLTLRFGRIKDLREDELAQEADSADSVWRMLEDEFGFKARLDLEC